MEDIEEILEEQGLSKESMEAALELARLVADFHRAGFVHRDLYLSHIFICNTGKPTDETFCLIDLQRVFRPKFRRRRWMVKDLAALNFSTPEELVGRWERLRFLCRYVQQ